MRFGHVQTWGSAATSLLERQAPDPAAAPDVCGTGQPPRGAGRGTADAASAADPADGQARPAPLWPAGRIAAVEALFGEGFIAPGGAPETLALATPLRLTRRASLMLLGGGLGGPAQVIVEHFGAWVASYEADEALRRIAAGRAAEGLSAGQVSPLPWNRQAPGFAPGSAHHVLAMEALRGAPARPVLQSLRVALRPHGQLVMTELVSDQAPPPDREFAAWCRLAQRDPLLPSSTGLTAELEDLGLSVHVVEDISARHIATTLAAWRDALRRVEAGGRPNAAAGAALVHEAELWLLRLRLMRRLGLKLIRWHAVAA